MADELRKSGTSVINSGKDIHVVTPLNNIHRKLMFQDNVKEMVFNQNVLLLISSISTGITVNGILELLSYYGAGLHGFPLYSMLIRKLTQKIHSLFTSEDIPGTSYLTRRIAKCVKKVVSWMPLFFMTGIRRYKKM